MKIIVKVSLLLAAAVAVLLLLSMAPLARPQQSTSEDRFVGFYIVTGTDISLERDEYWVEDGEDQLSVSGIGSVSIPRKVLFGVTDEKGNITFPGIEGIGCFFMEREEDGTVYTSACVDLADPQIKVGDESSLEGTLYLPVQERRITTFYRVYQKEDGRVYLDGSGNSYQDDGQSMSQVKETASWEQKENGQITDAKSLTITVNMEPLEQLESVTVQQFDEQNMLLHSWSPEIQEGMLSCPLMAETAWAMVEEHRADGMIHRTLLTPEDESYTIWFYKGEKGVSMTLELEWQGPEKSQQ